MTSGPSYFSEKAARFDREADGSADKPDSDDSENALGHVKAPLYRYNGENNKTMLNEIPKTPYMVVGGGADVNFLLVIG